MPGVGNIQVFGGKYAMRIWLDPNKLDTYYLSVADVTAALQAQNAQVEQLKSGLVTMKTKLEDLKARRSALVARARSAEAQSRVQEAIGSMDVMDPTSELGRFEDRIRQQEALVQGRAEAQSATLEDQFAELEDHSQDAEIEARLAALRQQG